MTSTSYRHHVAHLQHRTEHLLAEHGFDRLLIHSGRPKMRFQDDHGPAFRAHPYFVHWVPLPRHADGLLEIRPGRRPRLYLCVPEDFWHAPPTSPADWWASEFEIHQVERPEQWRSSLSEPKATALIAEAADFPEIGRHAQLNPEQLLLQLDEGRTIKTDWQIECMRKANQTAVLGHRAAAEAFENEQSELEIHLAYLHACLHEPEQLPYGSIIALNEHAAILHYQYRVAQRPESFNSFLIDAGADHLGYAADITRTYVSGGSDISRVFAALIDSMGELQQRLADAARPGREFTELNEQTHRGVAEILKASGLCTMSIDAMLEANITTRFLPHGLGHFIGIQVHDVGGKVDFMGTALPPPVEHPFLRLTRRLEQGNVVTIEPGLYFIPSLLDPLRESNVQRHLNWSLIDQLLPYGGIRIEDDVLVTDAAPENLTRSAFNTLSESKQIA